MLPGLSSTDNEVSSDKPVDCFFLPQKYGFFMSLQNNMVNECKKAGFTF
jgi:hypothetical protein